MKGWTKEKEREVELSRTIQALRADIKSLKMTLQNKENEIKLLYDKIQKMNESINLPNVFDENANSDVISFLQAAYPFLYEHIILLFEKSHHANVHAVRYKDNLKAHYLYLSQMGEFHYQHLCDLIGFPPIRNIQRFKTNIINKFGLREHFLDGTKESVEFMLNLYSKENINHHDGIIAIDAASVTASISVSKDGTVNGLMNSLKMDEGFSIMMKQSISTFSLFVELNKEEIIKYYFVGYFCPLSPKLKPFPILLKKSTSGAANQQTIVPTFEELILNINTSELLNIIGISFDGDPGWLKYVSEMLENLPLLKNPQAQEPRRTSGRHESQEIFDNRKYITEASQLDLPLHNLIEYSGLLPFEDLLHLMKCARYKVLSKACIPFSNGIIISKEDMIAVGIPEYVLNDSKSKKMEDLFPLLMFNMKIVKSIIDQKKYHMIPYFLPCALILESVFTSDMSRSKRLKYITIAFSLMWIYHHEITEVRNVFPNVFDKVFCEKFISLSLSFAIVISKNTEIHLGALGTHFLEHYFGKIRRLCKMDDSAPKFESSVQISIIIQVLIKYYGLKIEERAQKSRLSDSGAKLNIDDNFVESNCYSVLRGMQFAHKLLSLSKTTTCLHLKRILKNSTNFNILRELDSYEISFINFRHNKLSTLAYKMHGGSGYTGIKRVQSGSELFSSTMMT